LSQRFVVENIPLSKICIGKRRREKVGSLATLKKSLDRVGQIHPITVRPHKNGYELVAGERRLRSAQEMGWTRIRARVGKVNDEQLRDIELDENDIRLDLTEGEASRAKLKQILAAEEEAKVAQAAPLSPGRGHKGGDRETARRTGLSRDEVRRTKKHVTALDAHPELDSWKRSQVMAATEALEKLPKKAQDVIVAMASEPMIDPKMGVKMIENIAAKPAAERDKIVRDYKSGDEDRMSLAKTRAADLPPKLDSRYLRTKEAERSMRSCAKAKKDDLSRAYEYVAEELGKILGELEDQYEQIKNGGRE
jgi:ParB-like chromosome segregation protein Spo0J